MAVFASENPVPVSMADRLERELAEILAIYDRLFPDHALDLILFEGRDPVWGAPTVIEGHATFEARHLAAEYLGRIHRPGPFAGAPGMTVMISVPRPATPGETVQAEAPWSPVRPLGPVFALAPMLYEQIRYAAEMLRLRRARRRDRQPPLPCGRGASLLPQAVGPQGRQRPAILIGFHWLEVGGAEKLAFDCVRWALAAGLRVFVVASVPSLQRLAGKLPNHPDVSFIRLDRYLPGHLWPRFVQNLVLAENIRVVHIHHCQPLYEALPQLRVMAPWVTVVDSTHIVEYANGGYPRISGIWSNFIDIHHVISGALVDYYRDRFQVVGKVRLGRMLARQTGDVGLPPLNMQSGQKVLHVAFIGRLYYQKRPVVVAETLRALSVWARKAGVDLRGTIVGEGPFRRAMQGLLHRHGLADSVAMLPADTDVPALLRGADILLLPSNNEGLALVCYEAIAQGCIPVSTDVGSQSEIVPADLLLPLAPRQAVRRTVAAVDRLWREPDFLARQHQAMTAAHQKLAADPTAEEVLMPIYHAAAESAAESGGDIAAAPEQATARGAAS